MGVGGVRQATHINLDSLEFAFSVISHMTWYLHKQKENFIKLLDLNFINLAFIIRVITSGKTKVDQVLITCTEQIRNAYNIFSVNSGF